MPGATIGGKRSGGDTRAFTRWEDTLRTSTDHILTSHAGSLPRPDALIAANRAHETGEAIDERVFDETLRGAVAEVVRHQKELGIDIPGDGEFGKPMGQRVNYGSWWRYSWQRLGGLNPEGPSLYEMTSRRSRPGEVVLTSFGDRRDRTQFAAAYNDPDSGITTGPRPPAPICIAPLTYTGHGAIRADITRFKEALAAAGVEEGFMSAVAPGSASRIGNEYYKTEEELLYACADAMREEYKAILDAGLVLQLDDPCIAENWDQINPAPTVEEYQKFTMQRVEALNHAIRGLPQDRIRFHLCWGSWHGPHTTDIPMRDIVEVMLKIDAQAYSFEAGNVRHEHEWKVWQEVKLPDEKIILPGVVSHATNVVEHPELVADRISRFADLVGRERVIASTDCGLGGRVHPQIAWAKLEALAQGAALATKQLWR
jgi:5-methyltetrahydropteroyltriglutamate--homocysteine methyltransferase